MPTPGYTPDVMLDKRGFPQVISEDFLRQHQYDISAVFTKVLEFVPLKCATLVSVTTGIRFVILINCGRLNVT